MQDKVNVIQASINWNDLMGKIKEIPKLITEKNDLKYINITGYVNASPSRGYDVQIYISKKLPHLEKGVKIGSGKTNDIAEKEAEQKEASKAKLRGLHFEPTFKDWHFTMSLKLNEMKRLFTESILTLLPDNSFEVEITVFGNTNQFGDDIACSLANTIGNETYYIANGKSQFAWNEYNQRSTTRQHSKNESTPKKTEPEKQTQIEVEGFPEPLLIDDLPF